MYERRQVKAKDLREMMVGDFVPFDEGRSQSLRVAVSRENKRRKEGGDYSKLYIDGGVIKCYVPWNNFYVRGPALDEMLLAYAKGAIERSRGGKVVIIIDPKFQEITATFKYEEMER